MSNNSNDSKKEPEKKTPLPDRSPLRPDQVILND